MIHYKHVDYYSIIDIVKMILLISGKLTMNILLPISACAFLLSAHPSMSAEEKSISPPSDQAITIPDSLDGYTLTMTSKELKYLYISYYQLDLDNGAIVRNGEIGDYYEKNKENKIQGAYTSNSAYDVKIIFSKDQWTKGQHSGSYTCEKIGNDKLIIKLAEIKNGEPSLVTYLLFLYFKTSDAGNAYSLLEENIGGNISFILKKSSEKQ